MHLTTLFCILWQFLVLPYYLFVHIEYKNQTFLPSAHALKNVHLLQATDQSITLENHNVSPYEISKTVRIRLKVLSLCIKAANVLQKKKYSASFCFNNCFFSLTIVILAQHLCW
ncbi:hypothetical protein AYI70_g6925 [Smittium culicis]|uniref:Uncharacterized protein n=1 Tax=Smittium culicis TaxID=133412 RepID=A0A1R1XMT1_9FUNG|nr:hypothetical protein AYI70_g6925 [Smittium culicis]